MVLHDLCDALNRGGYPCGIIFLHGGNAAEQNFQYALSTEPGMYKPGTRFLPVSNLDEAKEILRDGIVVYPDLITGNPLGANRVVRYVLNFSAAPFEGDFVLSFSRLYSTYAHHTLFKVFHHDAFNTVGVLPWHQRSLNLTYFGKGPSFLECKQIPNTILVERDWPRDKDQLALLLKQCKFFFTWDCVSATNLDAVMCGAIPVFLHEKQLLRSELGKSELGEIPHASFDSIDHLPEGVNVDDDVARIAFAEFNARYFHYLESWPDRVAEFAQVCERHFMQVPE